MADQRWSAIYVVLTKIFCGRNFCVCLVTKLKFTGQLQVALLSLYPQFGTNLMSTRNVIELLLQLKSAKAHGKNYIRVKTHLVRHLLRNCLLNLKCCIGHSWGGQQGSIREYSAPGFCTDFISLVRTRECSRQNRLICLSSILNDDGMAAYGLLGSYDTNSSRLTFNKANENDNRSGK